MVVYTYSLTLIYYYKYTPCMRNTISCGTGGTIYTMGDSQHQCRLSGGTACTSAECPGGRSTRGTVCTGDSLQSDRCRVPIDDNHACPLVCTQQAMFVGVVCLISTARSCRCWSCHGDRERKAAGKSRVSQPDNFVELHVLP